MPPRIPSSRPLISHQYPDRLTLSWMPARVPSYVKSQKLTYIVEVREPPSTLWRSLTDNLRDTEYDVTDLNPEQDYLFRVRAKNEYGLSEPTMPVSVIRERGTELSFMFKELVINLKIKFSFCGSRNFQPSLTVIFLQYITLFKNIDKW